MILARYGQFAQIGAFPAHRDALVRGQLVVLRTRRGVELGEVLAPLQASRETPPDAGSILRLALPDDLVRASTVARDHPRRLALCQQIFDHGQWPLTLMDVEPLLDPGDRTIAYYLGPHQLQAAGLREIALERFGLDLLLQAAGRDAPEPVPALPTCGAPGCGSGGCGTSSHSACSSCGIKSLLGEQASRTSSR